VLRLSHRIQARVARALLSLPDRVQLALAGGPPITRDGHVLDPQVQHMLAMARRLGRRMTHQLPVEQAREEMEINSLMLAPPSRPVEHVLDTMLPGPGGPIPARIYRPLRASHPTPALVYYHGGGFVCGSLRSHDAVCRILADDGRCVVVSVDYRLAPEHRFPAAPDDALAAFRQVAGRAEELGIDATRIAVGGDSAGGNLAAVVSLDTRGDRVRPAFQLLVYPAVDLTMSFPSIRSLGEGFFLERATMDWFVGHYTRTEADRTDPRASPLHAPDVREAPRAAVFTAGFDPLRDEGEAYARKLAAAGVAVEHTCHGGMFHGYMNACGGLANARPAVGAIAAALRRWL
jgi:acetyl esterase